MKPGKAIPVALLVAFAVASVFFGVVVQELKHPKEKHFDPDTAGVIYYTTGSCTSESWSPPAPGAPPRIYIEERDQNASMVLIPAGPFLMGAKPTSATEDAEAMPEHEETTGAYRIDVHEVTNGRYAKFLAAIAREGHVACPKEEGEGKDHHPLDWGTSAYTERSPGEEYPVCGVDWHDARAYAAWAGKRLPTEAEWEKAARGTDGRQFPWGSSQPRSRGAFGVASPDEAGIFRANWRDDADGFLYASPVGKFKEGASPYGCMDMAGNAWEWTASAFALYPGAPPHLAKRFEREIRAQERVYRGGSFDQSTMDLQTTHRHHAPPETRRIDFGFRCAQSAR